MPAARRKGGGRGSAAAGRKQYKVGDLVLAKVKGFPAWPATVSEPEKWGYSRDRKKVFVYFYGTKQIGFCNPSDVEAFTEEKKKTLKRQGKGADFVRAVDEIIDSYEKSKNQNQDEINSGNEGTYGYGSSEGSKGRYSMKSQTPSPFLVQPFQPETSYASLGRSDSSNAVETPVICMEADVLPDVETVSEEPMKRTLLQSYVVQRRPPSVRRTWSSSRADLFKSHKSVVPVADVVKSSADVASNAISDESMTSKLIRKSSDCSISAAFVFNCSSEDVGSEIVATESEAVSFDEGSTQDSGYKIEHSEIVTDFSENGVETSRRQELLHTNTMLLKKRRKPNRKQVTNGTVTHAELDKGTYMEAGLSKNLPKSPDICDNSNVRFYEADGDAHLPLVKRARARMCNAFPEKTHVDEFVAFKETPVNEVLINCSSTTSFSSDDSYPAHSTSLEVKEAVNSLSPSKAHTDTTETHPLIWKGNNLLDDEAALPPSKRLHRALEAMSANLVETGCVEVLKTMEILSNVCRSSSEASSLCLAVDAKEVMLTSDYNSGCNTTLGLSLRSSPITKEVAETNTMAKPDELVVEKSSDLRLDDCKKMSIQVETVDAKDLDGSSVYTHTIENETDSRSTMEERNTMNSEPSMNCSDNVYKGEDASCQADKPEGQECSHPILEKPVSSSKADDAGNFSPVNGSGVHILDTNEGSLASDICKSMKTMSQTVESSKVRTMIGAEKECGDRSSGADLHQMNSVHVPEMYCQGRFDSISTERQKFLGKWNDTPEANAVWKSFEAVLETLSRTKDSIGRATRVAMDCAKYGIAGEVVKLLLRSLKHEPNLNRRVDLFFLVDSITQCSRGQKGVAGDVYPPAVQAALPQLLSAAAPPGNAARENRRQCLKVLRVWLRRKTLPEAIVRHHIRELDSFTDASLSSSFPRLPSRTERVCDDPVRGMDGMLVDEYGSNTRFHLSGFLMSRVFDDEEENSFDQQSFEAVTPEKDHEILDEPGTSTFVSEKHPHILEDVDGELEMEDVSPSFEGKSNSGCCMGIDNLHTSHRQFDQQQSLPFVPLLPEDIPPSPPLPSLPPLTAHPPPLPPLQSTMRHSFADAVDSLCYQGTQRMQNLLPQSMGQQPRTPNINLTSLDKGPCCAPGYRDHPMHMLTPIPSFSSGSGGIVHGSNLFIQSGNDIQKFSGATLSKALHLRPPPVTVSNQFSYLQANHHQGTQSRMAASSSSEGSQVVHEASRGHLYGHQGHSHLSKSETTYPPVSYVRPQTNYTPISSNWRSLSPRTLNYQHRVPVWRPPLESRRVNEELSGTRIKTRKRNIAAPLDPATFADAVVQIYLDNAGDLEAVAKSLESSDLNFSRYGDTFFEVIFTGGRTQPGTTKPDEGERHPHSVLDCEPKREAILPSVLYIQKILRRRPFLIKNLENVMRRFLQSLELFEENERKKLAVFTALTFSQKLSGLPPETVFQPLLKDNLVAKGLVLSFITDFFKEYLVDNSLDDLISLLKRGKMDDNLLEFFPTAKRSAEGFSEHFTKEGLVALVEYNEKKIFEVKLKEMKSALTTQIAEKVDISEVIETVKQRVKDANLPDLEVVRILWDVIMDAVQWSGKNQQQNANSALRQVKTWADLLNAFCTNGKLELELIYKVQIQCYEDAKLMKLFPEIVRSLYDENVLAEDTINLWFHKGANPKGRQTFVKALEPFVKWLEEAEEEE